ncbi:hypothetical protein CYMTET_39021 [Cymbomonas tetramitiformis]|uniref:RCK N-terminal domain-containing protein n=1 Tax=Cymbomonas tetramitiformis TaxID=36881 RepID=A0AAE0F4C3_9CHLO|nr:hypothetical protein CYMTET_39021 [Cymbomonas tetramitiformis]
MGPSYESPVVKPRGSVRVAPGEETDSRPASRESSQANSNGAWASVRWNLARVSYFFDRWVSSTKLQALGMVGFGMFSVVIFGICASLVQDDELLEGMWSAWTWMTDAGTHASQEAMGSRILSAAISLFGILYIACILGFVVQGMHAKMETLRKGKSAVVEKGHTVLLGWTDKSLLVIKEIAEANASEGGGVIAVLADQDKTLIEAEIHHHFRSTKDLQGTLVVVRNGSRLHALDLLKVGVETARTLVVLSDTHVGPNKADSEVLQVVLNLSNLQLVGHIVAEVRDIDNEPLLKLIGREQVETLVSHDVVGRLMLMSVREPGLSSVYQSVLGFEGNEFYSRAWPEITGEPFDTLQQRFPDAVPIGVRRGKFKSTSQEILLNPPPGYLIEEDDELIVFAEDNDTYEPKPAITTEKLKSTVKRRQTRQKERIFFAGWRRDLRDIISLLDELVGPETELHIMTDMEAEQRNEILEESGLDLDGLKNLQIFHWVGNTSVRRDLELIPIEKFTSVLILSDEASEMDIMQSDSQCLATLVLIRDIQARRWAGLDSEDTEFSEDFWSSASKQFVPIVTEILDPRTQRTVSSKLAFSSVFDFLQTNDMVAKIMAMVSEDRTVKKILDELLSAKGVQLEVLSPESFLSEGEAYTFYEAAMHARSAKYILIGFLQRRYTPVESSLLDQANSARRLTVSQSTVKDGLDPEQSVVINPANKDQKMMWDSYSLVVIGGHTETKKPLKRVEPAWKEEKLVLDSQPTKYIETNASEIVGLAEGSGSGKPDVGESPASPQHVTNFTSPGERAEFVEKMVSVMKRIEGQHEQLRTDIQELKSGLSLIQDRN